MTFRLRSGRQSAQAPAAEFSTPTPLRTAPLNSYRTFTEPLRCETVARQFLLKEYPKHEPFSAKSDLPLPLHGKGRLVRIGDCGFRPMVSQPSFTWRCADSAATSSWRLSRVQMARNRTAIATGSFRLAGARHRLQCRLLQLRIGPARGQVVGIDVDPHYIAQARWAAKKMELAGAIEFQRMQVYNLTRMESTFDLVVFMGVFYHLRYPLLALDIMRRKARRYLLFQSLTLPGREVLSDTTDPAGNLAGLNNRTPLLAAAWPRMAFIEHAFAGDPTNWWIPNHAAIEAMLRACGFHILGYSGDETYWCETALLPTGSDAVRFDFLESILPTVTLTE